MKIRKKIFDKNYANRAQHGGMMIEMLLTLALAIIILPFIFDYQKSRINRAENIAVANEMAVVQTALERYIELHKKELLVPMGKNITRVKITDLVDYGAPSLLIEKYGDNFQVRILKSSNTSGHATLQGIIVLNDKDISPMRTREIINLGDGKMGFVENGKAVGAFGAWRAEAIDFGIQGAHGLVETTKTTLDKEDYLWRLPSENASDATMLSALNLAGHDIVNAKFFDTKFTRFEEKLSAHTVVSDRITFQNRTTIDKSFKTTDATVSGTLSADSRNMEVASIFTLGDTAKLSGFTTNDLWVGNLNLAGLSVSSSDREPAVLRINQATDMVGGHITAMQVSVGFTGSVTPKLSVSTRIEDSTDEGYFWDVPAGAARFADVSFAELNRMAARIVREEATGGTVASQLFGTVATNKNATAADFMNAITEIQNRVRAKYHQLNLE